MTEAPSPGAPGKRNTSSHTISNEGERRVHHNCWERKTARSTASAERHRRNPVNVTSAKMQGRVAERKREKRGSVHSTKVPNDFLRYHTVRFLRADGLMANSGKTLVYFRGRTRESDVGDRSKPQLKTTAQTQHEEPDSSQSCTVRDASLREAPVTRCRQSTALMTPWIMRPYHHLYQELGYEIIQSSPLHSTDKLRHGLVMRDSNSGASNDNRGNLVTQLKM